MSNKWLWLIIVAVAGGGFMAGMVVAQERRKYPYLPMEYELAHISTWAEWAALCFTAHYNSEECLSGRLVKTGLNVYLEDCLDLLVGTNTQPDWNVYLGSGRFSCSDREVRAAYEEAAEKLMKHVRVWFSGIADEDVRIDFEILGSEVGTGQGGKMTLEGEE